MKNYNFFSSYNIFIAAFYLYYVISFIDYFLGGNVINYTPAGAITELIFINLFIAGSFIAGMAFKTNLTIRTYPKTFTPPSYKGMLYSAYTLILIGLILYAAFIYIAYGGLGGMLGITDRFILYQKKKGLGSFLIGLNICYVGILIRLGYYLLYRKIIKQKFPLIAVIIALLLLMIQYLNHDRANIIFFLLPLLLIGLYLNPKFNYHLLYIIPVLLIFMQVVAIERKAKGTQIIYFSEFFSPAKVDKNVYKNIHDLKISYGRMYIDVILNLPPSWIAPNRPDLPAIWYVKTFFPDIYQKGGGYGFSIMAESLVNFYFIGPVIFGFLLGILFLYLDRKLLEGSFYYFIIFCALQFYVFNIPRSGVASLLKPALATIIVPVFIVQVLSSYKSKTKDGSGQNQLLF